MRFGVLGPVEVRDGDQIVKIGGPQQQRLLAALLSQPGQVIEAVRLVDVLWPDDEAPEGASRSILTYVHRLRSAIGNDAIVTQGSGYAFHRAAGELDADEFEELVDRARRAGPDGAVALYDEAFALWRGRAFGPFGDEWWALASATRLDELRAVAGEERATALIATGNRARAVPELHALVVEYPLRETPVLLLAHALHATGRQVEALREIAALRERLADSGLDPSAAVVELENEILGGDAPAGASSGGRPLRGYVIHDAIGEGAHGRVYVATQPGTDRRVAIKMIRPDLADSAKFIARFEAEAQLVARLEHPHIVPLYDYWREPGGAYLVFRLLKRSASAALVTGGPWSLEHVSQLVEEVGGALLTAHAAGVHHGDVRAANVLLDDDGRTYLTDFGIAVSSNGRVAAAEPLIAHDIADFARLVWELLAGTAPAAGARPLPSLAGRVQGLPDSIDAVLAEAIDAEFASIADFILAWRAAVGRPEGVVTPIRYEQRATESARRLAARDLVTAATAGVNPYQGLRPFAEADAAQYFGRTNAVDALAAEVTACRFVAVVGASGSGKSSVVHAGLIPRLRATGTVVATLVPGARPIAALREALNEVAVSPVRAAGASRAIASVVKSVGDLVIFVDQFEECWTMADPEERDAFLDALATAEARIVVAVRADFYDRPLQHPAIGALVGAGTFALAPMTPAELDDAIVRPAARAGVHFDDGVVAALVADAAQSPGALPLLQFALAELYERRVDGRITAAALEQVGGISGSIGRRAEEIYAALDDAGQASVREVFGRLVTPGEGAADTRRRARLGDLTDSGRAIAAPFVDARLLVSDREPETREPVVEVAHEALLTHWPRLREWVEADRQWLRQLQHLSVAARVWNDAGRPDGELYRGARLEAAIEALPERAPELTPLEAEFVAAGRTARDADRERERRSARRTRRLLGAVAVALAIALVAGGIAFVQRGNARDAADTATSAQREAEVEALVGRIATLRSTQRDAAALLAIEAFKLADTPRTRAALLSTFTESPGYLDTHQLPSENDLYFGIVMADGKRAFVTTRDHLIRPYDLETGALGKPWPAMSSKELRFTALWGSPDGKSLAQMSDNEGVTGVAASTVGVFDVTTGKLRFPAFDVPIGIGEGRFSSDGKLLAAIGGPDESVIVYDATNGRELGHYRGLEQPGNYQWGSAGVSFLGDSQLAIGSVHERVRIVDIASMRVARELTVPAETTQQLFTIDNGRSVLGIGRQGLIRFNAVTGARAWFVPIRRFGCAVATVIESRGSVFCSDEFGRLEQRDLGDGHVIAQLDAQKGAASSLFPAHNDTELVEFGNGAPIVARWRLDGTGPITRRLQPGYEPVSYNPGGTQMISTKINGEEFDARIADSDLLDPRSGKVVDDLGELISPGWIGKLVGGALAAGPDFKLVQYDTAKSKIASSGTKVSGEGLQGGFNVGTGKTWMVYNLEPGKSEIRTIDIVNHRQIEPTITAPRVVSWDASADGTNLVLAADDVIIYDTTTGKETGRIRGHFLNGVHVTTHDTLLAWSLGGALMQYDLKTLKPIRALAGNRGYLVDVQSDARGTFIAASGGDRRTALYDIATGVAIGEPITVADGESTAIALRPDGRELAVGGSETVGMQMWDLDPHHWVDAACRVAGRNLTRDEWESNVGAVREHRATCPAFPAAQ